MVSSLFAHATGGYWVVKILLNLKQPEIVSVSIDLKLCPLNAVMKLYKSIVRLVQMPSWTCEHGNLTKNGLFSILAVGESMILRLV